MPLPRFGDGVTIRLAITMANVPYDPFEPFRGEPRGDFSRGSTPRPLRRPSSKSDELARVCAALEQTTKLLSIPTKPNSFLYLLNPLYSNPHH